MLQYLRQKQKKSGRLVFHLITDCRLLMTALAPALTSCMGVYEGGFECPPGEGVGCKSISEVNQMVDQSSIIGGQLSESGDSQKGASLGEKGAACRSSGACAVTSEIWYAPAFDMQQIEKCPTQDLDDQFSL